MNEQIEFLKSTIANARGGNEACVRLLRTVCSSAVAAAPECDIIKLAEFLLEIRLAAAHESVSRN